MIKTFALIIIIITFIKYFNDKIDLNNRTSDSIEQLQVHEELPYKKKQYLLSVAEKNFYEVLKTAIQDTDYYICPKVRLADIIYVGKTDKRQSYFNKIQSKHIDFLLCTADTLSPVIAIELDDNSHFRKDRIKRDAFVDKALKAAGLKIIRFNVKHSYVVNEIKEKIGICERGKETKMIKINKNYVVEKEKNDYE